MTTSGLRILMVGADGILAGRDAIGALSGARGQCAAFADTKAFYQPA